MENNTRYDDDDAIPSLEVGEYFPLSDTIRIEGIIYSGKFFRERAEFLRQRDSKIRSTKQRRNSGR